MATLDENDGRFGDGEAVLTPYPTPDAEAAGDRASWPFVPATVVSQCGPDEWELTVEIPSAARLEDGFLDATTLMEHCIRQGVPMRAAHEAVGKLVRLCEQRRCRLADLPPPDYESVRPGLTPEVYKVLGVANALAAFRGCPHASDPARGLGPQRLVIGPSGHMGNQALGLAHGIRTVLAQQIGQTRALG